MTFRDLRAALTLYRGGTLTLEQAARRSGVSPGKMARELRSHGISVREEFSPVAQNAA
jgi:predicted HTH domain antitoxin